MIEYIGNIWGVAALSLFYIGILFVVAILGNRGHYQHWQPYIYSLTLAIFCTTWAFYGVIPQAIENGWLLAPTYFGAIILVTLGWRVMDRIIWVAKRENSTTISDFIAGRFGHSRGIAVLVSLLCLMGIIPYIALQLKAVSGSFQLMTQTTSVQLSWYTDPTLVVALVMAVFSILFGTRSIDSSESHQGMMLAIAFESIVKLLAFCAVGIFAVYYLYDGFTDIFVKALSEPKISQVFTDYSNPSVYLTHALIGGIAIFALPRQFHVAVVEYRSKRDLKTARWLFPLYLIVINLFVLPLGLVALMQADMLKSFDFITLELPMLHDQHGIALLAYIGGLSAGTSMVIIASITLATMVSNEIILPIILRLKAATTDEIKESIIFIRRIAILIILLLAFFYYRMLSQYHSLSELGLLSFVAVAQFAPAMLIGLIWHGANRLGAYVGISLGFVVWGFCLFLPVLANAGWIDNDFMTGLWGIPFLKPYELFGFQNLDPIVHGTFWSLLLNTLGIIIGSLYYRPHFSDMEQAQRYVYSVEKNQVSQENNAKTLIHVEDLRALLYRFISREKVNNLLQDFLNPINGRLIGNKVVPEPVLKASDRLLSSVMGRRASLLLLGNLQEQQRQEYSSINTIMDEVSEVVTFNRDLLNSVLHSLDSGITVVDENLNLIAWNQHFSTLYQFPAGFLYVGLSAETVVNYIANHGGYGNGNIPDLIDARMKEVRNRDELNYVRKTQDGRYIELSARPISDNRYITIYNDVTEYRNIENRLRQSNEELELRVQERTQKLSDLNTDLAKANNNKTRFLAAAGHDLVQPLNSASLFAASIINRLQNVSPEKGEIEGLLESAKKLNTSLDSAEFLLNELLEISKLDADIIKPKTQDFAIDSVLQPLFEEFITEADHNKIELTYIPSRVWVTTDPGLLRRIIQNLLSNAIRYCSEGKVTFGVRRNLDFIEVQVLDTGPGIPKDQLHLIFDEFHRIKSDYGDTDKGLGLGLSIVQRICRLLNLPISVHSKLDKGTYFGVRIPKATKQSQTIKESQSNEENSHSLSILCIDNEQQILDGMAALLEDWNYTVTTALDYEQAVDRLSGMVPDLVMIDYHLDNQMTGTTIMKRLTETWQKTIPCVVITADYTEDVKMEIENAGFYLMKKPIKAMALRAMLNKLKA